MREVVWLASFVSELSIASVAAAPGSLRSVAPVSKEGEHIVRSEFGISYDPATLKVMTEAFDAAWQDIAGNYSGRFSDDRRTSLAKIIFRLADQGLTDGALIKENALQLMARRERAVPFAPPLQRLCKIAQFGTAEDVIVE